MKVVSPACCLNDGATTGIYALSVRGALPIWEVSMHICAEIWPVQSVGGVSYPLIHELHRMTALTTGT